MSGPKSETLNFGILFMTFGVQVRCVLSASFPFPTPPPPPPLWNQLFWSLISTDCRRAFTNCSCKVAHLSKQLDPIKMWSNKDMYESKTWRYAYFFLFFCNVGRSSWRRFVVSIVLYITRLFFSSGSCSWWSCRPRSVKSFNGKVQSSKAVGTCRAYQGCHYLLKETGAQG